MTGTSTRLLSCVLLGGSVISAHAATPDATAYARAERVLDYNLRGKVLNANVSPRWLADGRFWYSRQEASGTTNVLVSPSTRSRSLLFDDARLRLAMRELVDADTSMATQAVETVWSTEGSGLRIRLRLPQGNAIDCEIPAYTCSHADALPNDPRLLASPDGGHAAFERDNNLWLRSTESGHEHALTSDGTASHGYGVLPDFALRGIPRRQGRMHIPPFAVTWSPDGHRMFGTRYDERKVAPYPYLANAPRGAFRPVVHEVRLGLLGDAEQVRDAWFTLDTGGAGAKEIPVPEGWSTLPEAGVLGWSPSTDKVYTAIVRYDRPARLRLVEIDLRGGSVRTVLEERSDTRVQLNSYTYGRAAVNILQEAQQAVWFSERDGWGHLYLVDLRNGSVVRQLTSGAWLVRDVVGVNEAQRQVFFTAGGREEGDPYQRRLYRVSLDGGDPVLLTPEPGDHAIDGGSGALMGGKPSNLLSPNADFIVDSYSTHANPPVTVLRSTTDGRVLMELERADAAGVLAAGWRAPRRERVTAADGETTLYATVYLPAGYTPDGQYPVIDAMYGGPHITNAPVGFVEATSAMNPVSKSSLAELGFFVVVVDARGTPGRSKAFHDTSFLTAADTQLEDHVVAIRELAGRYPGMDLDRVGIYGHSFGGYSATRALLRHPGFYKVGVSSAGSHSFQGMYGGAIHGMDRLVGGQPVYADGGSIRPAANLVPETFRMLDNSALVDRLTGKLMLVYGDLDENAMPALTLQLAAALTEANKDYDLLYLPNQDHELFRNDTYFTRRLWDYFVRHLMGSTPPAYRIAPPTAG
ncbi:DPP IV N-terminal domain-containing protein [Stenotrophomonas tumulicola]|uniref:S9 family peptidase n=1 Tax=Stenotrophomonas tumulicola TaxID=1685415 RepID=UPI003CCE39F6